MRRHFASLALSLAICWASAALATQDDPRLEELFQRLQEPMSTEEARSIELTIWRIWLEVDDSEVAQHLRRGSQAMAHREFERALVSFNAAVELAPDMAETWNKRATLHYLMGSYEESIEDIRRTLALEPRHFGALSGLGKVLLALHDEEGALKAFEAALKVNPHMPGVDAYVRRLSKELRGLGI